MNLTITIASTDRTSYIDWPSFSIDDILNQQVNTCSFKVKKYGSKNWVPAVGNEIIVTDGSTRIFAGVIAQSKQTINGLLIEYEVECKDWTQYLDRTLVIDTTYTSQTVNAIISDLNTKFLTGFTITNVSCTTVIPSINFDRVKMSDCLNQLAQQVGYNWYVDYNKDIHFFASNGESAPFGLTDTNGNYIFGSLEITDDLTQLKNKVYVVQDYAEAVVQTINFTAGYYDKIFYFDYKFFVDVNSGGENRPEQVWINGHLFTTGVYGIDSMPGGAYGCLWHPEDNHLELGYSQGNGTGSPHIIGTCSFFKVFKDDTSIATYGEYGYVAKISNPSLDSAQQLASTILAQYKDKQQSGTFKTYVSGLKSGQIMSIASAIRSISGNFIIQRVSLNMHTPTDGEYTVEFATWRTLDLVNLLKKLV